jgi:hypothetical protein
MHATHFDVSKKMEFRPCLQERGRLGRALIALKDRAGPRIIQSGRAVTKMKLTTENTDDTEPNDVSRKVLVVQHGG